ncbi:protein of unknown function [Legionella fallonii LLAP-10]|uniref:Uncharacterized protein n=1 Tax=Legionella fallonii LLAP-10 TaxID=1212491 RepID=A0A098G6Y2_9GAMM|nr:protein of unknown function [Legionella fallonii LLAP-10]
MILLAQAHPIKAGLPEDWMSVSHGAHVDSKEIKIPAFQKLFSCNAF